MKVVGIVVEYNPLHNGHLHHINETKRLSKADCLIAVMSGNVVQRGEFSMFDKFTKTKWALDAGIDLVIELPGVFSLQSADLFAKTSVEILHALQCDALYFGSESGEVEPLLSVAETMRSNDFHTLIKRYLDQGHSYPTSADLAMKELIPNGLHQTPNNILGLQYIQAIHTLKSSMKPHAIKRIETDYYAPLKAGGSIQSATAIRRALLNEEDIKHYVPTFVTTSLKPPFITLEMFKESLSYLFKVSTQERLSEIFGMEEGLENRFLAIDDFSSVDAMVKSVLTPRYTYAKIKRALMHAFLHVRKEDLKDFSLPYIRVLGMNQKGQRHLNKVKGTLQDKNIKLITKLTKDRHPYLDIELRIARIYSIFAGEDIFLSEFKPVLIV